MPARVVWSLLKSLPRIHASGSLRAVSEIAVGAGKLKQDAARERQGEWHRIASGGITAARGSSGLEAIARLKAATKRALDSGVEWELRDDPHSGQVWRRVGEPTL